MKETNVILLVIDSFRFDSFDNFYEPAKFLPNLSFLKENGLFSEIIVNGQVTKFVMPSLFTQTFPLDYGGYNSVIKNRPKSFVEILKRKGFKTYMLECHDNDGPECCCDRGFDFTESIYDFRLLLQNYLQQVFKYETNFFKKEKSKKILRKKLNNFKNVLLHIAGSKNRVERRKLPFYLKKLSNEWAQRFYNEIKLLESNPSIVLEKIRKVEPFFYYLLLGEKKIKSLNFLLKKKIFGALIILENIFLKNRFLKLKFFTFRKIPLIDEVLWSTKQIFKENKFFLYAHVMDPHDRKVVNRPANFLTKLLLWPYWLIISKDKSFQRFLYDISLYCVDKKLGSILENLKTNNIFKNTKLVITGDHGSDLHDKKARGNHEIFGFRTHKEHITVPIIYFNTQKKIKKKGLHDSRSISASIFDDLNIEGHSSFKGKSIFEDGEDEIITESAVRGNCDIQRKDLYFTVTSKKYKAMFIVEKKKLLIKRLYDLEMDPLEIKNLIGKEELRHIIKEKTDYLFRKRSKIFKQRGIKNFKKSIIR